MFFKIITLIIFDEKEFVTGKAGRLVDLCITSEKFDSKLGEYGHYCPVALND